jgi:hypothetical protein
LPAVARIAPDLVMTADDVVPGDEPVVELWEVNPHAPTYNVAGRANWVRTPRASRRPQARVPLVVAIGIVSRDEFDALTAETRRVVETCTADMIVRRGVARVRSWRERLRAEIWIID